MLDELAGMAPGVVPVAEPVDVMINGTAQRVGIFTLVD